MISVAQARRAIANVIRNYPMLGAIGTTADETLREEMLGAQFVFDFRRAVSWLSSAPTNTVAQCTTVSSYDVKHACEEITHTYISNGAMIAAAIHLGFTCEPVGRGDPNWEVRLPVHWWKDQRRAANGRERRGA